MKRLLAATAFAAVLSLSGCATVGYKAKLPDVANNCMDDLRKIARIPLSYPRPEAKLKHVEFADIAKCHSTPGVGTTPVVVYQLDGVSAPAQISVSALLSTGGTFAAAIDVLDAEFRSIRRYDFDRFVRRGSEYSLDIFLNETDPPAAFVLISPDKAQAGKSDVARGSLTTSMMIPAGPVMVVYNTGQEVSSVRPFLEGGRLLVTAKPQGSAAFSKDSAK